MTSACRLFPLGHGVPENFNFWGEQRQWSYPPISGAVWLFTTHLSNASAKVLLFGGRIVLNLSTFYLAMLKYAGLWWLIRKNDTRLPRRHP